MISKILLAGTILMSSTSMLYATDIDYGTSESWFKAGDEALQQRLNITPNTNKAKNVILFVGDGMGISTLTAARILEGQMAGNPGEENYLSFETFPHTALVKTYNVDAQVADSAGTASAMNTGVKTRIGVINTAPQHPQRECENLADNALTTLAQHAEKAGLSTGVVSTARLTHATPAAVYSVSPSRGYENDMYLSEEQKAAGCRDIAQQLLDDLGGNGLEVALGGGKRSFLPVDKGGRREDGRDLTAEWLMKSESSAYVSNLSELQAIDIAKTDRLLGLFTDSHMSYHAEKPENEPSLTQLTETAIKTLSKK